MCGFYFLWLKNVLRLHDLALLLNYEIYIMVAFHADTINQ